MAQIFISYSRVDKRFVEALAEKLRRLYSYDNIWFDEDLHGGDNWWEEILDQIASRDIFIYVLSNESVESEYCKAEFTEARRLKKQVITIQARDRTQLTDELGDIHYVNMVNGVDDADALTDLLRAINKRVTKIPKRRPKPAWEPRTPHPSKFDEKPRASDTPDVDTAVLQAPTPQRRPTGSSWWTDPRFIISAVLVPIIAAIIGGLIPVIGTNQNPPPGSPTNVAQIALTVSKTPTATVTLTETATATETATPSVTPSETLAATYTPTLDVSVTFNPDAASASSNVQSNTPTVIVAANYPCEGTVINPDNTPITVLNIVYERPSESSRRLATLREGQVITIGRILTQDRIDWYYILDETVPIGYVRTRFIEASTQCP